MHTSVQGSEYIVWRSAVRRRGNSYECRQILQSMNRCAFVGRVGRCYSELYPIISVFHITLSSSKPGASSAFCCASALSSHVAAWPLLQGPTTTEPTPWLRTPSPTTLPL